jgi:serine/threonine protein kinase
VSKERYELLERIGVGSFATVYRARDTELGREVAVKQIAENFMHHPEQMERYWQEAQLLASLQHPNIITFFDIDRERGWLIMELMNGTLGSRVGREPMDLRSVRTALAHCLRALKYLHSRGIVHGDIKPGNLMVDARKRIKIGDFGLARRVSDDDGSLLKGTTKYMAPETVTEEFGEVGPSSDLYSLGFSAYELMCGPNFESLFPGLGAFGRDKQIAWMMWHSAADRNIPEITRVLEGVPEDLAKVVQKLVAKNQADRYQSAEEALSDLNIDVKIVKTGTEAPEEVDEPDKKRIAIAGGAFAVSLILSLVMLFSGGEEPQQQEVQANEPISGVVSLVLPENGIFMVKGADGIPQEVEFGDRPRILLNKKTHITAYDLATNDRVVITKMKDENGYEYQSIAVLRPDENVGYISSIQPQLGQLVCEVTEGAQRGEILIRDDGAAKITLNGLPAEFGELKKDDRLTIIRHIPGKEVGAPRIATEIVALQTRLLVGGFIREVTPKQLTIETHQQGQPTMVTMDVAEECGVTVNGQQIVEGRLIKSVDLQPGDRVTVTYHEQIVKVDAKRAYLHTGILLDLRSVSSSLIVSDENGSPTAFLTSDKSEVTINGQPAALTDLRRNDRLEVTYDQTKQQNDVSAVDALRPVIEHRFAIVIGNQAYDDNSLTKLPFAAADARLIQETLISRYGVSPDQTLLLVDETRVRLEQAIPDWLKKTTIDSELLVFVVGHAYVDDESAPYLAAKDFDLKRPAESGLSLAWLRQQLENCPADEKLLLLDICHTGDGADLAKQPAVTAMLSSVQPDREPAVFKTTFAIAASGGADRSLVLTDKQHGAFAWFAAEGLSGLGDKNQDVHLEPTELFEFLKSKLATVEVDKKRQQPTLFVPDATPPPDDRLSPDAKDAVRKLLATHWNASRMTSAAGGDFLTASRLCDGEPDAQLAYSVLLIKTRNAKDIQEARSQLEEVRLSHQGNLIACEALAWVNAYTDRYSTSTRDLIEMFTRLQTSNPEGVELTPEVKRILEFSGMIREFTTTVAEAARRPKPNEVAALDALVEKMGADFVAVYESAQSSVRDRVKKYDTDIAAAGGSADGQLLILARKRLTSYLNFGFDDVRKQIVAHLDDQ